MRKVMIVDDESLVRVGFQTIIDWENEGYSISGTYKNGLEAWEAIKREGPPDVLLTDIQMPIMDGLELIRKIREKDIDMNILILSSHDQFNYLRSSINLRVQDYILKHMFEPEELIQTLNKLNYPKPRADAQENDPVEMMEVEKQLLLQESRNISHVFITEKKMELNQYPNMFKEWGLNELQGYWVSVRTFPVEKPYLDSELKAISYILKELVSKFSSIFYVGMDQDTFHIIMLRNNKYDVLNEEIFNEWSSTILQRLDISIVIGISEKNLFPKEFIKMRKQAETAIHSTFYFGKGVYYCEKENPIERISVMEWANLKKKAVELLNSSDLKPLLTWMDEVGNQFAQRYVPEEDAIQFIQMGFRCFLESRLQGDHDDQDNNRNLLNSYLLSFENEIAKTASVWDELVKVTRQMIEQQEQTFSQQQAKIPWLKDVTHFIQEHYTEPIRLEDVARLANFNENYFSQLFRQEMGVTFLEYVTRLRIERAIKLLKNHSLSTEEISFQIGYPNSNYFVKVFKKVTGKTVSEYRSSLRS